MAYVNKQALLLEHLSKNITSEEVVSTRFRVNNPVPVSIADGSHLFLSSLVSLEHFHQLEAKKIQKFVNTDLESILPNFFLRETDIFQF